MAAKLSRRVRSSRPDIVVLGGANMDYLVRGPSLPRAGETIDGTDFLKAGGGKGANQAVAAARLGGSVAFIGKVGWDQAGDELLGLLRAEGVNIQFVRRDPKTPTGVALIMIDSSGEKQIMVAPGANNHVSVQDVRRAQPPISRAQVLLMQFEIPMQSVVAASRIACDAGVSIVLDPAPPHFLQGVRSGNPATSSTKGDVVPKDLINRVAMIRPNSSEARAMTGIEVTDVISARKAARVLLDLGAGAVAVQAGDAGDLLVWNSGEECFPRLRVKTVDATGAGDAFAGALAVALSEKRSLREAGAFANAAAALATTKFGAQPAMPYRAHVLRLMRRTGHGAEAKAFGTRTALPAKDVARDWGRAGKAVRPP